MVRKSIPEDFNPAERIGPATPIGNEPHAPVEPNTSFAAFMQKEGQASTPAPSGKAPLVSPFELAQGQLQRQGPTIDTLLTQVKMAQSSMGDLQTQLSYPKLKLKASHKYILKNKLSDAVTNLKTATAKMGGEAPEQPEGSRFSGPLGKFLLYLSDGQNQLESAKASLQSMKDKGDSLNPGDLLLIQIKMNKAQQEIDFTSVMLAKAIEDFKMLMQIQI